MTVAEMAKMIGAKCWMTVEGFKIMFEVLDVRTTFGNLHVLLTPVDGVGEKWCALDRVEMV